MVAVRQETIDSEIIDNRVSDSDGEMNGQSCSNRKITDDF